MAKPGYTFGQSKMVPEKEILSLPKMLFIY